MLANALLFSWKDSRSPRRNRYRDHDQPDAYYDPRASQYAADDVDPGADRLPYDDEQDATFTNYGGRSRSPRGTQRSQNPGRHGDYGDAAHDARPDRPFGSGDDYGYRNSGGRHGRHYDDHAPGGRDYPRSECLILGGLPDDVHEQDVGDPVCAPVTIEQRVDQTLAGNGERVLR